MLPYYAIISQLNRIESKMKTIKVQLRNVYGNELIYPMCEDSERFRHT